MSHNAFFLQSIFGPIVLPVERAFVDVYLKVSHIAGLPESCSFVSTTLLYKPWINIRGEGVHRVIAVSFPPLPRARVLESSNSGDYAPTLI